MGDPGVVLKCRKGSEADNEPIGINVRLAPQEDVRQATVVYRVFRERTHHPIWGRDEDPFMAHPLKVGQRGTQDV
jgi:hypothetical protein